MLKNVKNTDLGCANAIEKGIAENFDGYSLNTDFIKDVIECYGYERTMFILANTIQAHKFDGRISQDNKDWARSFFAAGEEVHYDCIIENSLLINSITNKVRAMYKELEAEQENDENETKEAPKANSKFRLTNEALHGVDGRTVYRIEAVKSFGRVHAGDKGGFVEGLHNLSEQGDCWIYDNAVVCGGAYVKDNAVVCDVAAVYDNAHIGHNAQIKGGAIIKGDLYITELKA